MSDCEDHSTNRQSNNDLNENVFERSDIIDPSDTSDMSNNALNESQRDDESMTDHTVNSSELSIGNNSIISDSCSESKNITNASSPARTEFVQNVTEITSEESHPSKNLSNTVEISLDDDLETLNVLLDNSQTQRSYTENVSFFNNEYEAAEADFEDMVEEINIHEEIENPFEHLRKMLEHEENNKKITEKYNVSRNEMMMAIMRFADSCFLTNEATAQLCQMINSFTETPIIPDTKYYLDKYFYPKEGREFHAVCPSCRSYVKQFTEIDKVIVCQECEERINVKSQTYRDYFVILNIKNELKHLIETNGDYYNNVVTNWNHEESVYKDIYDGQEYRKFVNSLPREQKHSYLTLLFNSDGTPVFKSSKFSLWPFQAVPNELPPGVRHKRTVPIAIWFGHEKPSMTFFLDPIVKKINAMSDTGIDVVINNEPRNIKVYAICSVVDSAARAPMQGLIQWNGFFGCSWCLHPGESVKHKKGSTVKYTEKENVDIIIPKRDEQESRDDIEEAVIHKRSVCGFTKASPLMNLKHFKIIKGFVPDRLHCLDLGVVRQFASYWFSTTGNPYSISKADIINMDKFIKSLKVPSHITRLSRSLLDRSFWKGRCWLNWLLHYSIFVLSMLNGFEKFFKHWLLLVKAIHLLMKDKITENELIVADDLLDQFVKGTQSLYGKHAMTYNVHQLRHLCDSVREYGPLWSHTGNVFESGNGQIAGMVHAASGVLNQICRNLSVKESIRIMNEMVPETENSKVREFCFALENKCTISSFKVNENRYFDKDSTVNRIFLEILSVPAADCKAFRRLLMKSITFRSCVKSLERSDNSFAITTDNTYIRIVQFVINIRDNQEYTIYHQVTTVNTDFDPDWTGMKRILEIAGNLSVIETSKLDRICVLMERSNCQYLSEIPYSHKFS